MCGGHVDWPTCGPMLGDGSRLPHQLRHTGRRVQAPDQVTRSARGVGARSCSREPSGDNTCSFVRGVTGACRHDDRPRSQHTSRSRRSTGDRLRTGMPAPDGHDGPAMTGCRSESTDVDGEHATSGCCHTWASPSASRRSTGICWRGIRHAEALAVRVESGWRLIQRVVARGPAASTTRARGLPLACVARRGRRWVLGARGYRMPSSSFAGSVSRPRLARTIDQSVGLCWPRSSAP